MDNLEIPQARESHIAPPDERLVKKLEPLRRDLVIPGTDEKLPKMSVYRTVWDFDPFQVQVGKGYRPLVSTYDQAVEMVAQDTQSAKAEDFVLFMNEEAGASPMHGFTYNRRANANPMLVFSSSSSQSTQFGFDSGYLIEAGIDKSVLIDHNKTRAKWGMERRYDVEQRIYLYGPMDPSWIIKAYSLAVENERRQDGKRASFSSRSDPEHKWAEAWPTIRTISGVRRLKRSSPDNATIDGEWIYLDHIFEKQIDKALWDDPTEESIGEIKFPEIRLAIKRAILLDGAGEKQDKTYKEGIKPLVKVQNLNELKATLDVFDADNLLLGDKKAADIFECPILISWHCADCSRTYKKLEGDW